MPLDLTDDKSTLVQVMAWCHQANVDPDLCCHMVSLGHNELTHWTQGDVAIHFLIDVTDWFLSISYEIAVHATESHQWSVNIGSSHGMVALANKP